MQKIILLLLLTPCGPSLDPIIRPKAANLGQSIQNKIEKELRNLLLQVNIKINASNDIILGLLSSNLTENQRDRLNDIVGRMNLYQDNFSQQDKEELEMMLSELDIAIVDLEELDVEVDNEI